MSADAPLCRVLENAILELCAAVERGGRNTNEQQRDRVRMMRIVNVMPLLCRALRDEAAQHEAYAPVLFYERVRLGWAGKNYFLEGVPFGVMLFAGETSITLLDDQLRKLRLKSIVADKFATSMKLENAAPTRIDELVREHSPVDYSACVPGVVRVFVARCRAICKGVRHVKEEAMFAHCSNANCLRLFYVGGTTECWANAGVVHAASDSEDEGSSSVEYWNAAACDSGVRSPSVRRFCCSSCEQEYDAHLKRVMPGMGLEFDADNAALKSGRARVSESLKLVLKRNALASRQLRLLRSTKRVKLAVADNELAVLAERHVAALNVDLGVLYAASLVAESIVLSQRKLLPGSRICWRGDPVFYSRALNIVRCIYFKNRRKEGIVSSLNTLPRFLQIVGEAAGRMF